MDEMNGEQQPATQAFVGEQVGILRGEFRQEMGCLRGEFRQEIGSLRGELHQEMGSLRGELASFRAEMREDFTQFKAEVKDILRPIVATLANHTAELRDMRIYMKTQLVTREEFHARMDAFAGRVDDQDYSAAKQRDRLDDHERRISALEKKPS